MSDLLTSLLRTLAAQTDLILAEFSAQDGTLPVSMLEYRLTAAEYTISNIKKALNKKVKLEAQGQR